MSYIFMGIIVPCAVLIPLAAGVHYYRWLSRSCRFIFYYLFFTAFANGAAQILAMKGISNMPVLHVDTLIETILFLLYFKEVLHRKQTKRLVGLTLWLFPVVCLANFSFFQSIYSFNTYTRPLEAIIFIVLSAVYWMQGDEKTEEDEIWTNVSGNWIISGIQLYFASALFLFIFSSFLATKYNKQVNNFIWNLHALFVLVMYLLFTKGLSKCKR